MQKITRFIFSTIGCMIFLAFISCTARSSVVEIPLSPTYSPASDGFATLVNISSTSIAKVPTVTPSQIPTLAPTHIPVSPPDGKILYEAYEKINYTNYQVINIETINSNHPTRVIEYGRKVDGQQVNLFSANMTWSPDGHRFAFIGTDLRANKYLYAYQDVYIAKADGSDIYRLTYSPQLYKWDIAWSPDGNSILVSMGDDGYSDLYLVDIENGEITKRLTSSGTVHSATWSPDGKEIALEQDSELFTMNIADMKLQLVSSLPVSYKKGISWSSDGVHVAFSVQEGKENCNDIYVINLTTGETVNVTSSITSESSPSWSPDGKYLAFSRASYSCSEAVGEGYWNIYITNLIGDEKKVVSNAGFGASIAWLPVPNLIVGNDYLVTELGGNLNLRSAHSLNGTVLKKISSGEVVTVIEGFIDADDFYWWKIRTQDGTEGWAVEVANWYKPITE